MDPERVRERTWRGSQARERTPAGRGIGLAITLDIVARRDLRLEPENRAEGGLEATLSS